MAYTRSELEYRLGRLTLDMALSTTFATETITEAATLEMGDRPDAAQIGALVALAGGALFDVVRAERDRELVRDLIRTGEYEDDGGCAFGAPESEETVGEALA